jgi:16S rRNA processing protein RimM
MNRPVLLARIVAAHGVKGHVKLQCFASNPSGLSSYGPLSLADGRTLEIARIKPANAYWIADFKSIKDRNAAEALVGQDVFVAREKLPPLEEGEFYLADLIGRNVMHEGMSLGAVTAIENYGAGDIMELASGDLVPVAFIQSVAEAITVDLPPGYRDPPAKEDQYH